MDPVAEAVRDLPATEIPLIKKRSHIEVPRGKPLARIVSAADVVKPGTGKASSRKVEPTVVLRPPVDENAGLSDYLDSVIDGDESSAGKIRLIADVIDTVPARLLYEKAKKVLKTDSSSNISKAEFVEEFIDNLTDSFTDKLLAFAMKLDLTEEDDSSAASQLFSAASDAAKVNALNTYLEKATDIDADFLEDSLLANIMAMENVSDVLKNARKLLRKRKADLDGEIFDAALAAIDKAIATNAD